MRVLAATPDLYAPSVAFTSPAAGNVSETITLAAAASDNYGVAGVQFKINDNNYGGEITSPPYQIGLDTHYLGNGGYTLTVVARDARGNTATATRSINVANSTPGAGWRTWGNLQSWYEAYEEGGFLIPGGWDSYRTNPPHYGNRWNGTLSINTGRDKTWWTDFGENYGGAGGPTYPCHYLPGNPDPAHYQMRIQVYYGRMEGGSDIPGEYGGGTNHVSGALVINGGEYVFFDNGPTYDQWAGLWNVNGGEQLQILRWAEPRPENNSCFMQDIRVYYDFVPRYGS